MKAQENTSCIPWFFPSPADENLPFCGPWESALFIKSMEEVPESHCKCYPSCNETIYQYDVTSAPFRECDSRNFGLSRLCHLNDRSLPQPYIYQHIIKKIYDSAPQESILTSTNEAFFASFKTTKRNVYDKLRGFSEYDAFEKDIAFLEVYYPSPTLIKMKTQSRMSWIDYLSTVGGLLGLVLGMGFMTFVEIFWLCLRIVALKLNFQNLVP